MCSPSLRVLADSQSYTRWPLLSGSDTPDPGDLGLSGSTPLGGTHPGRNPYSRPLKDALDFVVKGENIILSQGRWLRFNEDYVDQLNAFVDGIPVEETEPEFQSISITEPVFNTSAAITALGYAKADKDFSKISTRAATPVEAWDLYKDGTAYAVKFGRTQKLGYVCDQAILVLEILRTNANVKKLDQEVTAYCLWLGLPFQRLPSRLSGFKSIILKQKIDAWARKCTELGIQPKIKLSLRQVGEAE